MLRKNLGTIEWLEFELLQGHRVKHAVFLKGQDFSLRENAPSENEARALEILDLESGVKLLQVHRDSIYEVKEFTSGWTLQEGFDGVMTKLPRVGLMVRHADCQAAIFYDPLNHAIANVHCGWRGSVQNIYRQTVKKMGECYGTAPENLIVCISPSLGPDAAEFIHYKDEFPPEFWPFQEKANRFNFWDISKYQLMNLGIQEKHIEIAGICTFSELEMCYSYRRNKETGHHGTIAALSN